MEQDIGLAHFISQSDAIAKGVLLVLLMLSVASWYLIVTKALANMSARKRADAFLKQFWEATSLQYTCHQNKWSWRHGALRYLRRSIRTGSLHWHLSRILQSNIVIVYNRYVLIPITNWCNCYFKIRHKSC